MKHVLFGFTWNDHSKHLSLEVDSRVRAFTALQDAQGSLERITNALGALSLSPQPDERSRHNLTLQQEEAQVLVDSKIDEIRTMMDGLEIAPPRTMKMRAEKMALDPVGEAPRRKQLKVKPEMSLDTVGEAPPPPPSKPKPEGKSVKKSTMPKSVGEKRIREDSGSPNSKPASSLFRSH